MDLKLSRVTSPETMISLYPWIKALNFSDITPEKCLARCLSGEYVVDVAVKHGSAVGLVVYKVEGTFCWVVGLWGKNNLKGFPELFFDTLKSTGITTVRCSSTREPKAFAKLLGMKRLWSVFERTL